MKPMPEGDEAFYIEQKLDELTSIISEPHLARTVKEIRDAFQSKKHYLADIAYKEPRTGLWNKFYFNTRLQEESVRAHRYNRDLTMMVIEMGEDLSGYFKQVAGDVASSIRRSDTCAYIRDFRLNILLPETSLRQGERVANKIHSLLRKNINMTDIDLWIGVADFNESRNTAEKISSSATRACERALKQRIPVYTAPL
jgi:GGDEF domain-containing protein